MPRPAGSRFRCKVQIVKFASASATMALGSTPGFAGSGRASGWQACSNESIVLVASSISTASRVTEQRSWPGSRRGRCVMSRPRVLLADDHRMVAEGLKSLLADDFDLVGVVENGHALVAAARKLRPDVIVADITMPQLN